MALLSTPQVQAWVPQAAGEEGLIADAIQMAESIAAEVCGRILEASERTETFDVEHRQFALFLQAYPVSTIKSVYEYANTDTPIAVDAADYMLDVNAGILYRNGGYWPSGNGSVSVTYTGGYTSSTLPAGLRRALLQLVAWIIESRGDVGTMQESVDGHQRTIEEMAGPVPRSIGAMFEPWKARRIG